MAATRVLVVDDNIANLRLAEFLLAAGGLEVQTAQNAASAIELVNVFRPSLILMDIQLPGMDGLTLTRQLKQDPASRNISIIAMTAYAMRGDADRAREAGCDGYLSKPIDPKTFMSSVAGFLAAAPVQQPSVL